MGRKRIDMTGTTVGRLTVVRFSHYDGEVTWWECRCRCGVVVTLRAATLRRPDSRELSCGCFRREYRRSQWLKHGHAVPGKETPEYRSWMGMMARCYRPDADHARLYRDRGITVCQEWRDSFAAFLRDMGPRPSSDHSIDRINNDGNYEPSNCRWATRSEQAKNRRPRSRP